MNNIPVDIVSQEYDTFDPFISNNYPDKITGKITQCTLVLDDGVNNDIEIVGTYVDNDMDQYNEELAKSRAFENAANIAQGYGYVIK